MPPKGRRQNDGGGTKEWGHPDAMPLEQVDFETEYSGVITNVSPYGIFVDFGAVKDGLLRVPSRLKAGYFKRGMEVSGLKVLQCDPESQRVVLQPDSNDLPESVPRPPRRSASAGPADGARKKGTGQGGGGARARSASAKRTRDWSHSDAAPMEEFEVGQHYEGTVTNVSPYGTFVDIGCVRDARLNVPARIGRRFRIGDVVPDCRLEEMDIEKGRMSVLPENVEEVVQDLPPKEKPRGKAKAQPTGKPPQRQRAKSAERAPRPAPEDMEAFEALEVGEHVNGIVSNRNSIGMFVDIGVGKDAKVRIPKKQALLYKRGDEIVDLKIENVDYENHLILVSKEVYDEDGDVEAPKPKAKAKGKAQAKAKANTSTKDWAHPDGVAVNRFKAGAVADGVVTNIGPQGVFVDIGAVVDGILRLPRRVAKQFRIGDEVEGMTILSVDVESDKINLQLDDPELEDPSVPAAQPARAPAAPKQQVRAKGKAKARAAVSPSPQARPAPKRNAAAAGGARGRASSSPPERQQPQPQPPPPQRKAKNWGHPDGIPLEDLELGAEVSGVVTNCNPLGVFLDIGAAKDGKLLASRKDALKFRKGDKVEGMLIDHVDPDNMLLALRLPYELGDEPEEIDEEPPKAPPARRAAGGKAGGSGPPRRGSAPPGQSRRAAQGPPARSGASPGAARAQGRGRAAPSSKASTSPPAARPKTRR